MNGFGTFLSPKGMTGVYAAFTLVFFALTLAVLRPRTPGAACLAPRATDP